MNNKNQLTIIYFTILFFFLSGFVNESFGQNNIQTALEISKGNKFKYIKPGKRIKIWYEGEKYKVWVDSISPDKILTKNQTYDIDKISRIAIKYKGTIITGSIVGTAGLLFTGLGTYAIISGFQSNTLGGAFAVVIGMVIDIIGVPVTAIGSSILFIGKKYRKNKGWQFKAVQTE